MRPVSPARPEQPQSPIYRYPCARAGSDAAELWLEHAPLSMGEFRDLRFRNFVAGRSALDDYADQRDVFNDAFSRRIALAIGSASHVEAEGKSTLRRLLRPLTGN
jgi:hypothetical protein